jgi:CDP-diacylglycerol--glycerol-3-phosphate 3-phosphatidyltransferase
MSAQVKRAKKDPVVRRQQRRTLAEDALNIPNLLTMGRVVMIPVCLWFLDKNTKESSFWAAALFTLAAFTDMLDGYLARKLGVVSVLGKFLDPLADKLIVMACLVWMVPMGRIQAWAVVLLIGRELSVTGLRSVAASEGVVISAGQEGKMKTAFQMIGIVALILGAPYHMHYAWVDLGPIDLIRLGRAFVYLSLAFSLASAVQYFSLFGDAVQAKEAKKKDRSSSANVDDPPSGAALPGDAAGSDETPDDADE